MLGVKADINDVIATLGYEMKTEVGLHLHPKITELRSCIALPITILRRRIGDVT